MGCRILEGACDRPDCDCADRNCSELACKLASLADLRTGFLMSRLSGALIILGDDPASISYILVVIPWNLVAVFAGCHQDLMISVMKMLVC